jgi:hypothetical protein
MQEKDTMTQSSKLFSVYFVVFLGIALTQMKSFAQEVRSPAPPPEPTINCKNAFFGGTVMEVTKSSISIRWGDDKNKKAKKFSVSETLAAGEIPLNPLVVAVPKRPGAILDSYVEPIYMYRLTDVKVGDLVAIWYAHLDGNDICDRIRIMKRPGGQVPPLPEEAEKLLNPVEIIKAKFPGDEWKRYKDLPYIPYHEKMNAYWDLEDKGIPYPKKFGADRRWPVAPMPRLTSVTTPRTDN